MDSGVISVRYARALLKGALKQKLETVVYEEMQMLFQSYLRVPQLRFTIANPMLKKDDKQQLVTTATGGTLSSLTQQFLQLVFREGREDTLQLMAGSYITLYRQQKNITRGKLTTAVAVSPEMENKMKQKVEGMTHGTVEFNVETNPDIIGGFILEYDTYRMDASVKSKLNSILTTLRK